jgi:nucleoside-diphosphate kinase
MKDRTLALIKPDAVNEKNAGKIIDLILQNNFEIAGIKILRLSKERASAFYSVHAGKPFFNPLVEFMTSGKIIALALECDNAVTRWRELMGATDPAKAAPGTIRKLFGKPAVPGKVTENATHGSDSPENAAAEISFYFASSELT